jgi:hypothetical protein
MKFIKHILKNHLFPAILVVGVVAFLSLYFFGKLPAQQTGFSPGEYLDPPCGPTDPGCYVRIFPETPSSTKFLKYDQPTGTMVWDEPVLDGTFTNAEPTTQTVGGIPAGSTFPAPKTVQEMFDTLLYPYQLATFSSFYIDGQSTILEVGATLLGGAKDFKWGTTNSGNINTNSISIIDVTGGNAILASSLSNDGSESVNIGGDITKTSAVSHQWKIQGTNTNSALFYRLFTVDWRFKRYWGCSSLNDLGTNSARDSDIIALDGCSSGAGSEFTTSRTQTRNGMAPSAEYVYFAWPASFGGTINSFTVNGLLNNDWQLSERDFVNASGKSELYKIFRSNNLLTGTFNIAVQ